MAFCCRILIPLCLVATVVSTLRVYPHQLAYFNEVAGGPENGYKHLLHSNLDWGQDFLLVYEWLRLNNLKPENIQLESYGLLSGRWMSIWRGESLGFNKRVTLISPNKLHACNNKAAEQFGSNEIKHRIGYVTWMIDDS